MAHAEAGGSGGANAGEEEVRLLSVSWNQDASCFAAATTADFRVFQCRPFREFLRRVHEHGGGFAAAEMLFRSNIFATVSTTSSGDDHSSVVDVWDDIRHSRVWQHGYSAHVRAVRLSRDRVAVALDRMVRVYDLCNPAWPALCKAETAPNPRGLLCLSCRADASAVVAFPGTARGQVRVEHLGVAARLISAHGSELACLAMTVDGTVLATASVKGTLVRVFNTVDGTCLQEVRRGRDTAEIYSIAISPDLKWLAVSSDKGTIHVFSLVIRLAGEDEPDDVRSSVPQTSMVSKNARSSLSFMKGFLPNYFSSEWSLAQFRLPQVTRCILAFGEQNIVMIVGMDGSFYKCSFDPANGGDMVRKEYFRFLKDKNTPAIRT